MGCGAVVSKFRCSISPVANRLHIRHTMSQGRPNSVGRRKREETMLVIGWRLRAATAVLALAASNAAFAQAAPSDAQSAGQPPVTAVPAEAGIQDIVVTATKQSQSLQKVPVAITAISGDLLVARGITEIRGIQNFVPSARLAQEQASIEVYIRGVGSSLDYPQFEPPTSINFNGVYVPREGTSVGLYDVGQVEVLPGPQGTLYGGNTIGGTVNVNFRRPTDKLESEALIETGNYSLVHASFAQNVPISDVLAVRGAFDYTYHKGYQSSGADSADNFGARLSVLYKPTDTFSAYVWGAVADLNGHPANLVSKGVDPSGALVPDRWLNNDPWDDQYHGALLTQAQTLGNGQPQAEHWRYSNKMAGAEFNIKLSSGITLTYIPSYLKLMTSPDYWLTAVESNKTDHYEQTTHELRLAGTSGPVNWVAGLYGYYRTADDYFLVGGFDLASAFPVTIIDRTRIKGIAGFGQAIVSVADGLRVTVGGRYSLDDRTGSGRFFDGTGLSPYTYAGHFHHLDYKVGLDYDVTSKILAYAVVQTGYQPGTFNPFASTPTLSNKINSAKLTSYSAGFKSHLFNSKVQLNNEVFYYDYRGLFISAYDTVNNTNRTFNADKVEIYGDQMDLVVQPTDNDQMTLSLGYLHARFKSFTLPDGTNFNGNQLQQAPDWTISASVHHDFQMAKGYIRAEANGRYESSFFGDFTHTPGTHQEAYVKGDASLTYYDADQKWSFGAWVRNITNKAVSGPIASGSSVPFNALGATSFVEPPRTFGLRATVKM
jgi:iron complex outermembrane receptor protein